MLALLSHKAASMAVGSVRICPLWWSAASWFLAAKSLRPRRRAVPGRGRHPGDGRRPGGEARSPGACDLVVVKAPQPDPRRSVVLVWREHVEPGDPSPYCVRDGPRGRCQPFEGEGDRVLAVPFLPSPPPAVDSGDHDVSPEHRWSSVGGYLVTGFPFWAGTRPRKGIGPDGVAGRRRRGREGKVLRGHEWYSKGMVQGCKAEAKVGNGLWW